MANTIPIKYGEFYDFPRQIRFCFEEEWFYLRSAFDEAKDDYPDYYAVYLLPYRSEAEFEANPDYWMDLTNAVHFGRIPIGEIGLDETRRKSIDAHSFQKWLAEHRR